MPRLLFIAMLLMAELKVVSQHYTQDTTFQLDLNWSQGDQHTYKVTTEKSRLNGVDTISKERTTYDLHITVIDQTDSSYTIQWVSNNMETNSQNPIIQRLVPLSRVDKIIFRTNEKGVYLELMNWEEVHDHIQHVLHTLKAEFHAIPEWSIIQRQLEEAVSTRENLQSATTKDIQQYLCFHGREYQIGEVITEQSKVPNINGTELLDTDLTFVLEAVHEENTLSLHSTEEVNSAQLTNSTYNFLKATAKDMNITPPKRKDVQGLRTYILTSSQLDQSGWVISSRRTTVVMADNISNVESRIIEIR